MEMSDKEITDLLVARSKEKEKAVDGGKKNSTEGDAGKQVAEVSDTLSSF